MIDPNMTDEQIHARAAELADELEAARLEMKDGPEQYARHARASEAMTEFRVYWRRIGEAVDFGHPGKRTGISVSNNDGSVAP